jgi:hypothetical protein
MAKELTGSGTYQATVTCPEGGDPRTAASVEAGLQDLADTASYLRNELIATNNLIIELNAEHVAATRLVYPVPLLDNTVSEWGLQSDFGAGTRVLIQGTPNATHPYFWFPLPALPTGYLINQIAVHLIGASVHAVDTPPAVRLIRYKPSAIAFLGTTPVDDPEDAGYTSWHDLTLTTGNTAVEQGAAYYLRVAGELGTGAVSGLRCFGAQVTLLVPADWGVI